MPGGLKPRPEDHTPETDARDQDDATMPTSGLHQPAAHLRGKFLWYATGVVVILVVIALLAQVWSMSS